MKTSILFLLITFGCSGVAESSATQQLCTMDPNDPCCPGSPIIVDIAGDGIHLTAPEDGVPFQLRPGQIGLWAWTEPGSDDAFLVLDRDGSARIDDGSEMFGDGSLQVASKAPNGFNALAYYDLADQGGNGDGKIDELDEVWPRLRLWRDKDHDAFSAPNELSTLAAAGVHSFSLVTNYPASKAKDEHGNEFRFSSTIVADAPVSRIVSDVWLRQIPMPLDKEESSEAGHTERDYTEWTCWAYSYATMSVGADAPMGGGAQTEECQAPTVAQDPLTFTYEGRYAKLVARYSVSRTKSTAINRAHTIVFNAINIQWADEFGIVWGPCQAWGFPPNEAYYPPPYDAEYEAPFRMRVKCFSKLIHEGGGDGGGCAIAPSPL